MQGKASKHISSSLSSIGYRWHWRWRECSYFFRKSKLMVWAEQMPGSRLSVSEAVLLTSGLLKTGEGMMGSYSSHSRQLIINSSRSHHLQRLTNRGGGELGKWGAGGVLLYNIWWIYLNCRLGKCCWVSEWVEAFKRVVTKCEVTCWKVSCSEPALGENIKHCQDGNLLNQLISVWKAFINIFFCRQFSEHVVVEQGRCFNSSAVPGSRIIRQSPRRKWGSATQSRTSGGSGSRRRNKRTRWSVPQVLEHRLSAGV